MHELLDINWCPQAGTWKVSATQCVASLVPVLPPGLGDCAAAEAHLGNRPSSGVRSRRSDGYASSHSRVALALWGPGPLSLRCA